jgi:hypothetical protein
VMVRVNRTCYLLETMVERYHDLRSATHLVSFAVVFQRLLSQKGNFRTDFFGTLNY